MTREEMWALLVDQPWPNNPPKVETLRKALRQLLEETKWRDIATLDIKDRTTVIRPHVNWGPMTVTWLASGHRIKDGPRNGEVFHWFSNSYSHSWPNDAFEPLWMPLPVPPTAKEEVCDETS